jgi:hypothetical protein
MTDAASTVSGWKPLLIIVDDDPLIDQDRGAFEAGRYRQSRHARALEAIDFVAKLCHPGELYHRMEAQAKE